MTRLLWAWRTNRYVLFLRLLVGVLAAMAWVRLWRADEGIHITNIYGPPGKPLDWREAAWRLGGER